MQVGSKFFVRFSFLTFCHCSVFGFSLSWQPVDLARRLSWQRITLFCMGC